MAERRKKPSETPSISDSSHLGDSPLVPLRSLIPTHHGDLEGIQFEDNKTLLDPRSSVESDTNLSYPAHEPSLLEQLRSGLSQGRTDVNKILNSKRLRKDMTINFSLSSSPGSQNSSANLTLPRERRQANVLARKKRNDMTVNFTMNDTGSSCDNQENESPVLPTDRPNVLFKKPSAKKMSIRIDDVSESDSSKVSSHDESLLTLDPKSRPIPLKSSLRSRAAADKNMTINISLDNSENSDKSLGDEPSSSAPSEVPNRDDSLPKIHLQCRQLSLKSSRSRATRTKNMTFDISLDSSKGSEKSMNQASLNETGASSSASSKNENTHSQPEIPVLPCFKGTPMDVSNDNPVRMSVEARDVEVEGNKTELDSSSVPNNSVNPSHINPVRIGNQTFTLDAKEDVSINPVLDASAGLAPSPLSNGDGHINDQTFVTGVNAGGTCDHEVSVKKSNSITNNAVPVNSHTFVVETATPPETVKPPDWQDTPQPEETPMEVETNVAIPADLDLLAAIVPRASIPNPATPTIGTSVPHKMSLSPFSEETGVEDAPLFSERTGANPEVDGIDSSVQLGSTQGSSQPEKNLGDSLIQTIRSNLFEETSKMQHSNKLKREKNRFSVNFTLSDTTCTDSNITLPNISERRAKPLLRKKSSKISIPYRVDDTVFDGGSPNTSTTDDQKQVSEARFVESAVDVEGDTKYIGSSDPVPKSVDELNADDNTSFLLPSGKCINPLTKRRLERNRISIPYKLEDTVIDSESSNSGLSANDNMVKCQDDDAGEWLQIESTIGNVNLDDSKEELGNSKPVEPDVTSNLSQYSDALSLGCSLDDVPRASNDYSSDSFRSSRKISVQPQETSNLSKGMSPSMEGHSDTAFLTDGDQSCGELHLEISLNGSLKYSGIDSSGTSMMKADDAKEEHTNVLSEIDNDEAAHDMNRSTSSHVSQNSPVITTKNPSLLRRSKRGSKNVTVGIDLSDTKSSISDLTSLVRMPYKNPLKAKSRLNKMSIACTDETRDSSSVSETDTEAFYGHVTSAQKTSTPKTRQSLPTFKEVKVIDDVALKGTEAPPGQNELQSNDGISSVVPTKQGISTHDTVDIVDVGDTSKTTDILTDIEVSSEHDKISNDSSALLSKNQSPLVVRRSERRSNFSANKDVSAAKHSSVSAVPEIPSPSGTLQEHVEHAKDVAEPLVASSEIGGPGSATETRRSASSSPKTSVTKNETNVESLPGLSTNDSKVLSSKNLNATNLRRSNRYSENVANKSSLSQSNVTNEQHTSTPKTGKQSTQPSPQVVQDQRKPQTNVISIPEIDEPLPQVGTEPVIAAKPKVGVPGTSTETRSNYALPKTCDRKNETNVSHSGPSTKDSLALGSRRSKRGSKNVSTENALIQSVVTNEQPMSTPKTRKQSTQPRSSPHVVEDQCKPQIKDITNAEIVSAIKEATNRTHPMTADINHIENEIVSDPLSPSRGLKSPALGCRTSDDVNVGIKTVVTDITPDVVGKPGKFDGDIVDRKIDQLRSSDPLTEASCDIKEPSPAIGPEPTLVESFNQPAAVSPGGAISNDPESVASLLPLKQDSYQNIDEGKAVGIMPSFPPTTQTTASSLRLHLTTFNTEAGDATNIKSHCTVSHVSPVREADILSEKQAVSIDSSVAKGVNATKGADELVESLGPNKPSEEPGLDVTKAAPIEGAKTDSNRLPHHRSAHNANRPSQQEETSASDLQLTVHQNILSSGKPISLCEAPTSDSKNTNENNTYLVPNTSAPKPPREKRGQEFIANENEPLLSTLIPTAGPSGITVNNDLVEPAPRKSKRKSVSFKPSTENLYHSPPDNGSFQYKDKNAHDKTQANNGYEFSRIQMTTDISEIQSSPSTTKRAKRHFSSTPISKSKKLGSPAKPGDNMFAEPQPLASAQPTNHQFLVPPVIPVTKRVSIQPVPEIINPMRPAPQGEPGAMAEDAQGSSEGGSSYDLSCENSLEISAIPKDVSVPKWGNVYHSTPLHRTKASIKRTKKKPEQPPEVPPIQEHPLPEEQAGARVANHSVQTSHNLRSRSKSSLESDITSQPPSQSTSVLGSLRQSARRKQTPSAAVAQTPKSGDNKSSGDKSGGEEPANGSPANRISIQDNTIVSTRIESQSRSRGSRSRSTMGSTFKSYDSHHKMTSRRLFNNAHDNKSSTDAGYPIEEVESSPKSTDLPSTSNDVASTSHRYDDLLFNAESSIVRSEQPSFPRTEENTSRLSALQPEDFSDSESVVSTISTGSSSSVPSHVVTRQSFESQLSSLRYQSQSRSREKVGTHHRAEPPKPRSKYAIIIPNRASDLNIIYPVDVHVKKRKRTQSASAKLFNPGAKWKKSKQLYAWLKKKLQKEYKLRTNLESELLVIELDHARVLVSQGHKKNALDLCIERLKNLKICTSQLELWGFFMKFMPYDFVREVVPMGGAFGQPFDLDDSFLPFDPI